MAKRESSIFQFQGNIQMHLNDLASFASFCLLDFQICEVMNKRNGGMNMC